MLVFCRFLGGPRGSGVLRSLGEGTNEGESGDVRSMVSCCTRTTARCRTGWLYWRCLNAASCASNDIRTHQQSMTPNVTYVLGCSPRRKYITLTHINTTRHTYLQTIIGTYRKVPRSSAMNYRRLPDDPAAGASSLSRLFDPRSQSSRQQGGGMFDRRPLAGYSSPPGPSQSTFAVGKVFLSARPCADH